MRKTAIKKFEVGCLLKILLGPFLNTLTMMNCFCVMVDRRKEGRGGGGNKKVPYHPPLTSTNVGISPHNFLVFSFNPFATLVQNFKATPNANPKLLNLNQDDPSKKWVFWSNPYKIDVMVTSLIEMLQLPNFGHMTTSTI